MSLFGTEFSSWVASLILAAIMIAFWQLGWHTGKRHAGDTKAEGINVSDSIMGLFALLLGFTVSMSLSKHDQRRLMMANDANCISDFTSTAAVLKPQHRDAILPAMKNYVALLVTPVSNAADEKQVQQRLQEIEHHQETVLNLVRAAIQEGTPVAVPLMVTYNSFTSSYVSRLASLRDRLPLSVVFLLVLTGAISFFLQGYRQGEAGSKSTLPSLVMILLISLVMWVILDLNEPNRGMITVSKEPMERLLMGLSK